MKGSRKLFILLCVITSVIVLIVGVSYAIYTINISKDNNFKIKAGNFLLELTDGNEKNEFEIDNNMIPIEDDDALDQAGYTFTVSNNGSTDGYYKIYVDDVIKNVGIERLDNKYVKYNLLNQTTSNSVSGSLKDLVDNNNRLLIDEYLNSGNHYDYKLNFWLDYGSDNGAQNKYFAVKLRLEATQANAIR